eukprot:scaffold27942_cov59-Phaeocystis_antarctica.AAC.2
MCSSILWAWASCVYRWWGRHSGARHAVRSCSTRLVTVGATRTHDRRDGPRLLRGAAPTVDDGGAPHSLGVRCHPARQQVQRWPGAQPPPTHPKGPHVH